MTPPCTRHSRAVWPKESWYRKSAAVAWPLFAAISKVDAPVRISTPGHSTSGEEGGGDAGCGTAGLARKKGPSTLFVNGERGPHEPMLDAREQPVSSMAPISSVN